MTQNPGYDPWRKTWYDRGYLQLSGRQGQAGVFLTPSNFFDGYKGKPVTMEAWEGGPKGGAACLACATPTADASPMKSRGLPRLWQRRFGADGEYPYPQCGGMAVANSIMAVGGGASQVQGTFLGFGERCGNAKLSTVVANLQLKRGIQVSEENLKLLT